MSECKRYLAAQTFVLAAVFAFFFVVTFLFAPIVTSYQPFDGAQQRFCGLLALFGRLFEFSDREQGDLDDDAVPGRFQCLSIDEC